MARIQWDRTGERFFETGVDRGVLYVMDKTGTYGTGVAWNGLTAVNESPSGAEANPQYADNIKYLNLTSAEEFGATIEAFTYPPEFAICDGTAEPAAGVYLGQQPRRAFGFAYRTLVGNDTEGNEHASKLHLVYGAKAAPSEKSYATVNDSPEPVTFSWELTADAASVGDAYKPTASITIDSRKVDPEKFAEFEAILYGDDTNEARLPTPSEVLEHFAVAEDPEP